MVLAARGFPGGWLLIATLVGGSLAAGSANTINCYVDRDIDQLMHRTRSRPLVTAPSGAPVGADLRSGPRRTGHPRAGLHHQLVVCLAGRRRNRVLRLRLHDRSQAPHLVEHRDRWCRRLLPGAHRLVVPSPVRSGWGAVLLFLIVFLWTPPHFWALAMRFKEDYAAAGVPMLPVVATPVFVARRIVMRIRG